VPTAALSPLASKTKTQYYNVVGGCTTQYKSVKTYPLCS
jgi:hypothetical protein